jgi:hypothetical protein
VSASNALEGAGAQISPAEQVPGVIGADAPQTSTLSVHGAGGIVTTGCGMHAPPVGADAPRRTCTPPPQPTSNAAHAAPMVMSGAQGFEQALSLKSLATGDEHVPFGGPQEQPHIAAASPGRAKPSNAALG